MINRVKAKDKTKESSFHVYNKLKMPLRYTGTIMIGKNLFAGSRNRTFFGRYSYDYIYELEFEKGILLDFKETSNTYHRF